MAHTANKPNQRERIAELRARVQAWQDEHDAEEIALMVAEFQGYSPRNAMLIMMQCPDATEVHGFKAWLDLGRVVRKGEAGIQILAPAGRAAAPDAQPTDGPTDAQPTDGPTDGGEGTRGRQFFRLAYVFDIAQTDPLPAQSAA